ncbi:MAG: DUF2802 domain-containing protein [Chromatiales bacterium]|nr:DUF2802 domain-containing protein [Chromatiales bacterium]
MIIFIPAMCGFAALMILLWWRQEKRLRSARNEAGSLSKEVEDMRHALSALCTGARGTGGHLGRIDRELLRIGERQDRIERQGGAGQSEYERAVRMIRAGAGVDELVEQCGLGRAEAELLLRMQSAQAATSTGAASVAAAAERGERADGATRVGRQPGRAAGM